MGAKHWRGRSHVEPQRLHDNRTADGNGVFNNVVIRNGAIIGFADGIRAFNVHRLRLVDLAISDQQASSIVISNASDVTIRRVAISQPVAGGGGIAEGIAKLIGNRAHLNGRRANGGIGILLLAGSTDNLVLGNKATGHLVFDMFSNSTPNTWIFNTCGRSSGGDIDYP